MHLLLNDYAGHEFPVHLSKEWVRRGHRVTHNYCSSNITPHADFEAAEAAGIDLAPIDLGRQFEKHRPLRRVVDELDYGFRSMLQLRTHRPDRAIAAQLPVLSLIVLQLAAKAHRIPMTLWLQDVQADIARGRSAKIGRLLEVLENFALRRASTIVTISEEMAEKAREANPSADVRVIENWADIDRIAPGAKSNAWSRARGYDATFNFIYSGTLGIKHRPVALADLASALASDPNVRVIVVSQGEGTNRLRRLVEERGLTNIDLLPLQPASDLVDVLAAADVLVALLEEDAASGCVPSKILAYLAAGRPMVALFPAANLATRILNERSQAGFAVQSSDDFVGSARKLLDDAELRLSMRRAARSFAEATFDITTIANQFDAALGAAEGKQHVRTS